MPGILDFMNDPENALGFALLAAGGPTTDPNRSGFGQRIAGAVAQAQAQRSALEEAALKRQFTQSQIAENQSQADYRKQQLAQAQAQMALDAAFFGQNPAASAGGVVMPGVNGAPSGQAPSPTTAAAMPVPGVGGTAAPGAFTAQAISERFGIPLEAVIADRRFNGGKKIAELISDRSKPNWVNIGGNLVNTNAPGFQGGLQDQVSVSNDGKATVIRANGGDPVVGAPRGALETFGAYEDIKNRTNATYSPGRPVIGPGGRMYGRSQLDEINEGSTPPAPRANLLAKVPGMAGRAGPTNAAERGMAADVAQVAIDPVREIAEIRTMLDTPGMIRDKGDRAQAEAQLRRLEAANPAAAPKALIGNFGAGGGRGMVNPAAAEPAASGGVEFSPREKAEQAAEAELLKGRAGEQLKRESASSATQRQFSQMSAAAKMASDLLDQGPTGSGVGALVDKAGSFVGQPVKGQSQAAGLKAVGGWLVANVPRMEGPQSDRDVANYSVMAGQVGDETLPPSVRKEALKTVMALQEKYKDLNGGAAPAGVSNPAPNTTPGGFVMPSGWSVRQK